MAYCPKVPTYKNSKKFVFLVQSIVYISVADPDQIRGIRIISLDPDPYQNPGKSSGSTILILSTLKVAAVRPGRPQ